MEDVSLDQGDAKVRRQSYVAAAEEIRNLDDLILHMNHGKARLTGTKHDRGLNFLVGLLLGRAFNSLWRARDDAVSGYQAESLTLCRSALEHWAAARWVEFHPDYVDRWLWAILPEVREPTDPKEWPPATDAMLRDLAEIGAAPLAMYDILSKFAHPRSIGLSWMIHFDPESTYFHAGGYFDQRGLRMCLYFLIGVAQACLEPIARLQNRMLGGPDADWVERGKDLSLRSKAIIERMQDDVLVEAGKADANAVEHHRSPGG
jgi:hypothetical protein